MEVLHAIHVELGAGALMKECKDDIDGKITPHITADVLAKISPAVRRQTLT